MPRLFFLQIITLSFVLLSCASVFQFKNDLFQAWERQIPEDAPNYFLINIFEENVAELETFLGELGLEASESYPIVRGRLVKINGEPIQSTGDEKSERERRVNRELNLTWTNQLPYQNRILQGEWLTQNEDTHQVSIEEGVAERLGVQLNDELTFSIALRELTVKVTSLREVHWDTMTPNFYMIFSPGVLNDELFTYMMSLYVAGDSTETILKINKAFPEVNVLDIQVFIDQIRQIKDYVSLALGLANTLLIISVIGVLASAIATTWDERLLMYSIGQLVGMPRQFVIGTIVFEYALLGLICGLIAAIASQGLAYWGYAKVFNLPWVPSFELFFSVPVLSALALAGFAAISVQILLGSQALERARSLTGR